MNGWTIAAWVLYCLEARTPEQITVTFARDRAEFEGRWGTYVRAATDGLLRHGLTMVEANAALARALDATVPVMTVGPVVTRALREHGIELCTDRATLAWRIACAAFERTWKDSYEENSARQLARAILSGDDDTAEYAALWLVDPSAAMRRAQAELPVALAPAAPTTGYCDLCERDVPLAGLDVVDHGDRGVGVCNGCADSLHEELCEIAAEHRDAWVEALDGHIIAGIGDLGEWPVGSLLPWEIGADHTPANDNCDAGEAA